LVVTKAILVCNQIEHLSSCVSWEFWLVIWRWTSIYHLFSWKHDLGLVVHVEPYLWYNCLCWTTMSPSSHLCLICWSCYGDVLNDYVSGLFVIFYITTSEVLIFRMSCNEGKTHALIHPVGLRYDDISLIWEEQNSPLFLLVLQVKHIKCYVLDSIRNYYLHSRKEGV